MNLRKMTVRLLGGLIAAGFMARATAEAIAQGEKRTLRVIEDRGQKQMATKVYELKHTRGTDLTPFVLGAVRRYSAESAVERLSSRPTNQHFLIVSTGVDMMPYVDDIVAKLDRPGKIDADGSVVHGTGITNAVFYPRFRMASEFLDMARAVGGGDGAHFIDPAKNMVYWKNSASDGNVVLRAIQLFDRPVPQVEMTLNVYTITDGDMRELGIDYISWKNGPGADIFAAGLDVFDFQNFIDNADWTQHINTAANLSHTWGGFMVAPQIDATFLRMLHQKGRANIATSGVLTFTNDFAFDPGPKAFGRARHKIRFTPTYQSIMKDRDQNVSVTGSGSDFYFYLRRPTVTFNGFNVDDGKVVAARFGWDLQISDTVEKTSTGADIQDLYYFTGWTTKDVGGEKLLASFSKEQNAAQDNAIPVLGDIPILKYIFGATTESKSHKRVFVTVSTKPLDPKMDLSQWAGEIVDLSRSAMKE